MTSIAIISRPHTFQRYNTVGDYIYDFDRDHIHIFVSQCSNPDYEFLLAIHELVEAYLAKKAKIPEEEITKFDLASTDDEPGDSPAAPYHQQHLIATKIEKIMAQALNVNWKSYEQELDNILKRKIA